MIPDVVRRRRRKQRASDWSHSIPRLACGGAMLTLLRVRPMGAFGADRSSTALSASFECGLLAAFISAEFTREPRWKADHSD